MASADVTLPGSAGRDFEADTTQRTATLNSGGGSITNPTADVTVWVNENGGEVSTTSGGGSIPILPNATFPLNSTTRRFTFKTASGTAYPIYKPRS